VGFRLDWCKWASNRLKKEYVFNIIIIFLKRFLNQKACMYSLNMCLSFPPFPQIASLASHMMVTIHLSHSYKLIAHMGQTKQKDGGPPP